MGDGTACYDIDECALFLHDCPEHSSCINEEPFFKCYCGKGYKKQSDICADVDECSGINEFRLQIFHSVLFLLGITYESATYQSVIVVMQTVKILMAAIHVNVSMDLKVMVKSVLRLMNVLLVVVCQIVISLALIA